MAGSFLEFGFVENFDAELLGFSEFGAGFGAGNDEFGFFADGAGGFTAEGFDEVLDFLSAVVLQRAGDDDGLAGERFGADLFLGLGQVDADVAQVGDCFLALGTAEEAVDALGEFGADTLDFLETLGTGLGEGFHGRELIGEDLGGTDADVWNIEGGEQARQWVGFALFDVGEQIVGTLGTHAFQGDEFVAPVFESIQVGEVVNEAGVDQLFDECDTDTFDVHLTAGAEVPQSLLNLGGTGGIDASQEDAAFVADGWAAAFGTLLRGYDGLGGFVACFEVHADYLGDDLACFFDVDHVADAYVEPFDLVEIVERCALDGGAGQLNGVEVGNRCNGAELADLEADGMQFGSATLRFKFVGNAPTWETACCTECVALVETVDFDHEPVDGVILLVAFAFPLMNEF